jgi:hypothetical protein
VLCVSLRSALLCGRGCGSAHLRIVNPHCLGWSVHDHTIVADCGANNGHDPLHNGRVAHVRMGDRLGVRPRAHFPALSLPAGKSRAGASLSGRPRHPGVSPDNSLGASL